LQALRRWSSGIVPLVPGPRPLEHSARWRVAKIESIGYIRQRVGYRVAYQRGIGWRALSLAIGAILPLASNIPPARASTNAADGVVVVCPRLDEAPAAELEARARATLLTSDLSATVAISCLGEGVVVVQVDAGGESVTLKLRVLTATLREEVLRALDRALADLGARLTAEGATAAPALASSTVTGSGGSPLGPDAAETLPPPPTDQPDLSEKPRERERERETEVSALFVGESWGNQLALGAALRAALRFDSTWSCGIRTGVLHPLALDEATVIEAHALLEVAGTARGLAGLRFAVGAGPSLLFVSPESEFVAPGATLKSALRIEAQIGRPFRWRRAELTPWVGARAFTAERGLRVAEQARLVVGGVRPQFGLALSLLH
jgi:hypothetical protein